MIEFIILDTASAEQVRGPTGPHSALEPLPLADGVTYVLPEAVLHDPAHAIHHELLDVQTIREVTAGEWPTP